MKTDKLPPARFIAIRKAPYFAHALYRAPLIITTAVPVAAMDMYGRMYINPQIVENWTPQHIATVLVHEMFHFLNEHFTRKGTREQKRWNIATDMEIANTLRAMDFQLDIPTAHITPEQYNLPENLLAEEYYDRLEDNNSTDNNNSDLNNSGHSSGSSSDGIEKPWELPPEDTEYPALSETEQEILRREVAHAVEQHYKERGSLPAYMERFIKHYKKRKEVNWREILRRYVKSALVITGHGDHYTYRRPNRRYSGSPFIFPSLARVRPEVAVVIDTSGSMDDTELNTALNEVNTLLQELRSEVAVLSVDAEVHTTQRIRSTQQIKLEGGGGTNMMVGVRTASTLKPQPNLIIVITDGDTDWDAQPPQNTPPVIAVLTKKQSPTPPAWIHSVRVNVNR